MIRKKQFKENIIVVFAEGDTEKNYLNNIRIKAHFKNKNIKFDILPPKGIRALENEIKNYQKDPDKRKSIAIFDREDINKPTDKKIFDGLIKFCTTNKINYLYSVPSFEVWLLLHKQKVIDLEKITNGNKAKEQVKEKFQIHNNSQPEYEKVFSQLETATAIKNSKENKIPTHLKEKISTHEEVEFITNFHELFDIMPNS